MQLQNFDVVVIGGGLAGSVCASRLATQGMRVALVERSAFERTRVGEVITIQALHGISKSLRLSPTACENLIYRYASFLVSWGDSATSDSGAEPSHCVVDRTALDLLLFQHASECGVTTWHSAKLSKVVRRQDHWSFSLVSLQGDVDATAKLAIEATGRTACSAFSAARGRIFQDTTVACSLRFESPAPLNNRGLSRIIIESAPHGWWYSCQLSATETLVAFFTDRVLLPRNCNARSSWLLDQMRSTRLLSCYTGAIMNQRSPWLRSDARMSIRRQCSGAGWLAIGDAQMALDPLSGQGMQQAERSALESVPFIEQELEGAAFQHQAFAHSIASRYNAQLEQRSWTYDAETKWPNSHFWMRRHGRQIRMPITEDAFANTTMGN